MRPWKLSRRRAVRLAGVVGVLPLAAAGYAWWVTGELVAPRPREAGPPPNGFREVSFASDSGARLSGWRHQGTPGRGVVVLLHGIRTSRRSSMARAKLFLEAGYSTLVFDLRCHGESTGECVTLGWLERLDARSAVRYAKSWRPDEPVVVVGFSLGGAAAALASPLEVDAMVLEAVFPTIRQAIDNRTRSRFGWLGPAASLLLESQLWPRVGVRCEQLRPVAHMDRLGCPVLIVGGSQDRHTTPAQTRALYEAAAGPKELVWFYGLGHRNYAHWQPERYRELVVGFVDRHVAAERGAARTVEADARAHAPPTPR